MSESLSKTYAFPFQPGFRLIGLLILGLISLVFIIFVLVFIFSPPRSGQALPAGIILVVCLGLFWGFGWYFYSRHSGRVLVNDEMIALERFGRTKRMALKDVVSVNEWDWNIPPGFVLRSRDDTLSFSRMIVALPQLYEFLSSGVAVLRVDAIKAPVRFFGRRRYLREYALIFALIAVIIGIPFGFALPNQENILEAISMYFFSVFIMAGMGVLIGLPGRRTPVDLVLEKDRLNLRNLYGRNVSFAPEDITEIRMQAVSKRVRSDGIGVTATDHAVLISFRGEEKPWQVDSQGARRLRTTPERLAAVLRRLYRISP